MRLEGVPPRFIEASLSGGRQDAAETLGGALPSDWPDDHARRRLKMRLVQIIESPISADWLLRGMVRHSDSKMIGYINFHGAPDERGRAELGFTVCEEVRRQGYATDAVMAMMEWAQGLRPIEAFVVSISPQNQPSLSLAASLGFERVGSQMDEIDGEEFVFELNAAE